MGALKRGSLRMYECGIERGRKAEDHRGCVYPCKQSFRAVLIACPHYQSARSKKCADKG